MSNMNKAMIIGNLGKDPETRTMNSGDEVVSFTLASNDRWTDKQTGEARTMAEWHSIVIFNPPLAKLAKTYLRKGSRCRVEGKIQTRKWQDKTGGDRWTTEIVLQKFGGELELLDGRQAEAAERPFNPKAAAAGDVHDEDDVPF